MMTDAVTISLIGGVFSFLASVVGLLNNLANRRHGEQLATQGEQLATVKAAAVQTQADVAEARETITVLEKNTNSIKDALVKVTGEEALARGRKEGAESAKAQEPKA